MSIHVEQRDNAPSKVQSGTFAILYDIQNSNPNDLRLSPMIQRAQQAADLEFYQDVRPTFKQQARFRDQVRIHIVDILLKCCSSFEAYEHADDQVLLHPECRKASDVHRTKQFPLRTSIIEENSVAGNISVIDDVYLNQLKMTHDQLSDRAVPSIDDQSTNARIRDAKALRTKDVNTFTRIQFLQLRFGLFHLTMNLIWALLHVHRGSVSQVSSLSYFFAVLGRTRLACEHPDYHTLVSTLLQILRGIILNAWRVECGQSSLAAFASSDPSPDELLQIADKIIQNHATPSLSLSEPDIAESESDHAHDHARHNLLLLTRDLLYVLELIEEGITIWINILDLSPWNKKRQHRGVI
ncbi:hypothetical protein JVU11DRAFT_9162 [Chiua virens]|nr:hypothetical protein JVU11DRAFT_9162 [Chiua virens]